MTHPEASALFEKHAQGAESVYQTAIAALSEVLAERDAARAKLAEAVEVIRSQNEAIITWLHVYAPDECKPEHVQEAEARLNAGGTLAYISEKLMQAANFVKENGDG